MEYSQAGAGRIFIARIDDGENLIEELKKIIMQENIKAGMVYLLGAISKTKAVLGPHKKEYPPDPYWWEFDDAREIMGMGIFAWENNEPKLHLHAGIGHSSESRLGCIRGESSVYITVEAVIQELTYIDLSRKLDPRYNASLLDFNKK